MIRKRRQNFERILGVAEFDLRNLRALKTKLDRDYLAFFEHLSGLYHRSAQKSELQVTVVKIKKVIGHLDSILEGRAISKKDVDSLTLQINEINEEKDYFVEKIPEVQAFSDRVDKVSKETGIAPEDLNITEDIVKGVTKGTRRAQKEGVAGFARSRMPGTLGLAKRGIHGAAAAVAGPFAGLLPIASELIQAGGAGIKKLKEKRELSLAGKLRSRIPTQAEAIEARKVRAGKGQGSLAYFFNRTAYRTRWTRELLSATKKLSGRGKGSLFGGLAGVAGALGKGAGLAGAAVFTTYQLNKLAKTVGEYLGVLKNVKEHKEKQARLMTAQETEAWKKFRKATSPEAKSRAKLEIQVRKQAAEKEYYKQATSGFWNKGLSGAIIRRFAPSPTEISFPKNERNVPTIIKDKETKWEREELLQVMKNTEEQNKKLSTAIDKLATAVDNSRKVDVPPAQDNGFPDQFSNAGGDIIANQD
jgi:hypothetical protein